MLRFHLATIMVDDYDRAINYYVGTLGFTLVEDTDMGDGKRWVVVRPGPDGTGLQLARAATSEQRAAIGNQTGGPVGFFLRTDDFDATYRDWTSKGVIFVEEPRHEEYGTVAVFEDLYGNKWDLIQPTK